VFVFAASCGQVVWPWIITGISIAVAVTAVALQIIFICRRYVSNSHLHCIVAAGEKVGCANV